MGFFDINIKEANEKTLLILCVIALALSTVFNVLGVTGTISPLMGQTTTYVTKQQLADSMKIQEGEIIKLIRSEFATKEVIDEKMKNINEKFELILKKLD